MTKGKSYSSKIEVKKEDNINEILKDFFDEILVNLNLVRVNFQKSGDEKLSYRN